MLQDIFFIISQPGIFHILLIVIGGYLFYKVLLSLFRSALQHGVRLKVKGKAQAQIEQRVETLFQVVQHFWRLLVLVIVLFMVLSEFGVDIIPLITGAGVLGLAVSFGSQRLLKDVFSGAFILVENQYVVGDMVRIAGVFGTVQDVTLRRTVLRDLQGVEHHIPHSEITVVSNYTKEWSGVQIDIPLPYSTDVQKVLQLLRSKLKVFSKRKTIQPLLVEELRVIGVSEYTTNGILVRILGKTLPNVQLDVEADLREFIQEALREEKIELGASHFRV